jgi:hypothetical protein
MTDNNADNDAATQTMGYDADEMTGEDADDDNAAADVDAAMTR